MKYPGWLTAWMGKRRAKQRPFDPLADLEPLSVQRLEERRVLSATAVGGIVVGDVVINVTGNDTVTANFNSGTSQLTISDTDGGTSDIVIDVTQLDSLTFQLGTGNQQVLWTGNAPIPVAELVMTSSAGVDSVQFQEDLFADEGGVSVNVTGSITIDAGVGLSSTAGDLTLIAGQNVVMGAGSSLTATGFTIDVTASSMTLGSLDADQIDLHIRGGGAYLLSYNDNGTGGTTGDDSWELSRNGSSVLSYEFASNVSLAVTGAVNSSDSLTIDFTGGDPIVAGGVTFNGLAGSGSDSLIFENGSHTDTIYTYTTSTSGNVNLDGSVVTYTGVEPITNSGVTVNAIFNLPGTNDTVTLGDLNNGTLQLTGTTISGTTITDPTGSLTINGQTTDTINLAGSNTISLATAGLAVTGGAVNVSQNVEIGGDFSSTGSGNFNMPTAAVQILAGGAVSVDHVGTVTIRGVVEGTSVLVESDSTSANAIYAATTDGIFRSTAGDVTLNATAGSINFASGSLTAANGTIDLTAAAAVSVLTATTTGSGGFESSGTTFTLAAGGNINVVDAVDIDHTGAITLRGSLTGERLQLRTTATGANAIYAATAAAVLTSTGGDIELTATTGGVNFALGGLAATSGSVLISAATSVSVLNVSTTVSGGFQSSGTTFTLAAGGGVNVVGAVDLNHTDTITLRAAMQGASLDLESGSTSANAIYAATTDVILTSTGGLIHLNATSGGINFASGTLTATNGNLQLNAVGNVSVGTASTTGSGGFQSLAGGTFSLAATGSIDVVGAVTIDHTGTITIAASVEGSSIAIETDAAGASAIVGTAALHGTNGVTLTNTTATGGVNFGGGSLSADTGDIIITSLGNVVVASVETATSGNFQSTGTGTFSQLAGGEILVAGTVSIEHTGAVTLRDDISGTSVTVITLATTATAISSTGLFTVTATAGAIDFQSGGGISFASADLSAASGSGVITLTGGAASTANVAVRQVTAGDSLTIENGGTFTIGAGGGLSVTGDATLDANGAVTLGQNVTVGGLLSSTGTGTLTVSAGVVVDVAGNIEFDRDGLVTVSGTLDSAADLSSGGAAGFTLASTGQLLANNITLTHDGAVSIGAAVDLDGTFSSSGAGTFTLVAATGLDADAGVVLNQVGTVTLNADVTTLGAFSSQGAGAFTLASGTTLDAGTTISLNRNGAVTLNGAVTSTGQFHSQGTNNFSLAATGSLNAGGILLEHGGTTTISALTQSSAGWTSSGTGTFTVAAGGSLQATSDVSIDHGGSITLSGAITGTSITLDSDDTTANAVRAATSAAILTATTGDITVISDGGISFSAGDLLAAAGSVDLTAGAAAVIVGDVNAGQDFNSSGTGTFSTTSGATITANQIDWQHTGLITINTGVTAATSISLQAGAGVTESGIGSLQTGQLLLSGSGTFNLALSNDVDFLGADITGSLSFTDTDSLTINTADGINTGGNDVTLTTGGQLTIGTGAGELIQAAGATVTLNVTTGGVQTAQDSAILAGSLRLLGAGEFSLGGANDVDVLAGLITGALEFHDVDDLTIGTVTTAGLTTTSNAAVITTGGNLLIDRALNTGSGDLTLDVTGTVTQSATGNVTAAGLLLQGSGSVTLLNTGNNVTTLAADYDGSLSFRDTNALHIGTVQGVGGITLASGDLNLTVAQLLTIEDTGVDPTIGVASGSVVLTLGGGATQASGASIVTNMLQIAGAGTAAVLLQEATNDVDTFTASYGGTLAFVNSDELTVGAITTSNDDVSLQVVSGALSLTAAIALGSGDLTLNAAGTISQTAAGSITTTGGLRLLGSGSVDLSAAANNVGTLAGEFTGDVTFHDTNGLIIGAVTDTATGSSLTTTGLTVNSGDLTLTVDAGNLTQTAGANLAADGLELLGGGAGTAVRLNNSGNNIATLAANYGGTLSYTDTDAFNVGSVNATTGLTTAGADVTLTAGGDLELQQAVNLAAGDLTINVNGDVTQSANGILTATGLRLLGSGQVLLNTADNNVSTLAAAHTGAIVIRDINGLTIGAVTDNTQAAAATTTGVVTTNSNLTLLVASGNLAIDALVNTGTANLTLDVTAGTISQSAGITANGLLLLGSGASATLTNTANNVTTFASAYAGDVSLTDANTLVIGSVTDSVTGLTADGITNAAVLALNVLAGSLTQGEVISADSLLLTGAGTVLLNDPANSVDTLAANHNGTIAYTNSGNLTIGTVGATVGITTSNDDVSLHVVAGTLSVEQAVGLGTGDLTLNAAGAISQTAAGSITAGGLRLLGSGSVDLSAAANNVSTLAGDFTGDVTFHDTSGLNIGAVTDTAGGSSVTTTGLAATGDLSLTVDAGGLTQTAGANITAAGLEILGAGTGMMLTNAGNNVQTLAANYAGTFAYTDVSGFEVGTVNSTSGITTTNANAVLIARGNVAQTQAISLGTGTLTLDVVGDVTHSGAGAILAGSLRLLGVGEFSLGGANDVDVLAGLITGALEFNDVDDLAIGTVTTVGLATTSNAAVITTGGNLLIDRVLNSGSGDLTLDVTGTVTQSATGNVTAAGLLLQGSGSVTLLNAGNDVTTLAADYDGSLSFRDANALHLGTVQGVGGITLASGDLNLTVAQLLTIEDTGSAPTIDVANGSVVLTLGGGATQASGASIVTNTLQIAGAGTAAVLLQEATNDVDTFTASYGGTIAFVNSDDLVVGAITTSNDDVSLQVVSGALSLTAAIALGSGDLTLNAVGAISQTAAGSITTTGGLRLLGSGSVDLSAAANNVGTLAGDFTGDVTFHDTNGLIIGAVTDTATGSSLTTTGLTVNSGDLTLTVDAGNLTQTAGANLTASGLELLGGGAGTAIRLNNSGNNIATLAANYGGTLSYTDTNAFNVGSVNATTGLTTAGADVTLTAGGDLAIQQAVALGAGDLTLNVNGDISQTAAITANGLRLLGTGSVRLNNSGNNITTLAAAYDGTMAITDLDGLTVGTVTDNTQAAATTTGVTTTNNDLRLTATTGNLVLTSAVNTGTANLTLVASAGSISQTAALTAGGLQLAGGGGTVNLQTTTNAIGTVAANYSGAIALTDASGLIIGTVTDSTSGLSTNGITTLSTLTLQVLAGALTQTQAIDAGSLLLLGAGTVTLDNTANAVDTLAASYNGTITYTNATALNIGTVDATSGITTSTDDVSLTVLTGNLSLSQAVLLGSSAAASGHLTLDVRSGTVTQSAALRASGLQLLGSGAGVTLTNAANDVITVAASYSGGLHYVDANALTVGTVTHAPTSTTTSGINSDGNNVTLETGGLLTIGSGSGQDITATGALVVLNVAAGGVTEQAGSIITAQELAVTGTGTFTLAQDNQVSEFAADVNGNLTLHGAGNLDITTVNGVVGITTGQPGNGGDLAIVATGELTVSQVINTSAGTGGVVTVAGATINAALLAGAGDISLTGGSVDLIINVDQTTTTTLTLSATRDVIINAVVTTTGSASDLIVTADSDNDGSGGVQVTAAGQLVAGDDLTLTGSDLVATTGSLDSIRIDADGANNQLVANGQITLQHQSNAPALANLVIDGRINATDGGVILNASNQIRLQSQILATGAVVVQDAVVLTGDLTVSTTGAVTFQSTIDDDGDSGTSSQLQVTAAGITRFGAAVGTTAAISQLTTDAAGSTEVFGNVRTVNGQTWNDAVVLHGNAVFSSTAGGAIRFASTVNSDVTSPRAMTVTTSGLTQFDGAVGQTRALASLTTNGGGETQINGGLIRTTGAQQFVDNVSLGANTQFTSVAAATTGAAISVSGTLATNGFNTTVDAGTQGNVTFAAAISGGGQFTVSRGNVQQFAAVTVGQFTVSAATTSVTLNGTVNATGAVSVTSAGTILQASSVLAGTNVTYSAGGNVTLQGTATATAGNLSVTSGGVLSASQALTAATGITLSAVTGSTLAAAADLTTTGANGNVSITGPLQTAADISTNRGTITMSGPVTLTGNVAWDSDRLENGGAAVLVQGSVATGGNNLTVDGGTGGDVTFQQAVSGGGVFLIEQCEDVVFSSSVNVTSLTVQQASTSVAFNGNVTAAQGVTVNSLGTLTQAAAATVSAGTNVSYTAAGTITVSQAISAGQQVSINSTGGNVTLSGPVTATAGTLTVTAAGTLSTAQLLTAGGDVTLTSTGNLTSNGAIQTGGSASLTSTAGRIIVGGTINAAVDVELDADTTLAVSQAITAGGSFSSTSGTTTSITAAIAATAGSLTMESGTSTTASQSLSAGTDVTVTAGTSIALSGPVTAGQDLLLTATGTTLTLSGTTNVTQSAELTSGSSTTVSAALTAGNSITVDAGSSASLTAALTATAGTIDITTVTTLAAAALTAGTDIRTESGGQSTFNGILNAGNDIDLTSTAATIRTNATATAGNDVTLTAATGITVTAAVAADQNITLFSGATVAIQGTLAADNGTVSVTAGSTLSGNQAVTAGNEISFVSTGQTTFSGSLTAGDRVSVTSQTSSVALSGAVDTGADVILSASTSLSITNTVLADQNVELTSGTTMTLTATVTSNLADIIATAGSSLTAGGDWTAAGNVQVTSTTGATTLNGFVDAGLNLQVNAGTSISLAGGVIAGQSVLLTAGTSIAISDDVLAQQDVELEATSTVTLTAALTATDGHLVIDTDGNVSANQPLFAGTDVVIDAGGTVNVSGSISAGNDVDVTSGSTLTLSGGVTAARDVLLDSGAGLTVSQNAVLAGRHVQMTANTTIGLTATVTATSGSIVLDAGTSLTETRQLQAAVDILVTSGTSLTSISGPVIAGRDFQVTSGSSIALSGGVTAGRDIFLDSTTGTTVSQAMTAQREINIQAGTSIGLTAVVTATTGSIVLDAGTSVTDNSLISAAVDLLVTTGTSVATFSGPVQVGRDFQVTSGSSITLSGGVTAGRDVLLDSTAGTSVSQTMLANREIAITAGTSIGLTAAVTATTGSIVLDAGTSVTDNSLISAAVDLLVTTGTGVATFSGPVQAGEDVVIDAGSSITLSGGVTAGQDVLLASGGNVAVSQALTAQRHLEMLATGDVNLTTAITAVTGHLTVAAGDDLTATQALSAATLVTLTATDIVSLQQTVTAGTDLTITAGSTLSATQQLTAGNAFQLSAGTIMTLAETADLLAGAGGVQINAANLVTAAEITTTAGGDIAITAAAVQLTGDVTIDTSATGDFTVTGSVDGTAAYAQSLYLNVGTGNISISGNVGTVQALNQLIIDQGTNVAFGGGIAADMLWQQNGLGTTSVFGEVITQGADGIRLTTQAITFAAGTASIDSLGNPIVLTADEITLPTKYIRATDSTVTLQTLTAGTVINLQGSTAGLDFSNTQLNTIEAANLIIGSATQTGGINVGATGAVSLDENLTLLTAATIQVSGPLSATAGNWLQLTAGDDIIVNGSVSVLSGDLTLAADDDIQLGSSGQLLSTSGNVQLLADADQDASGTGGSIVMANGAIVNSGLGMLTLQADENIVVGQLISANATAAAITLTSLSGGIVDGGDAGVDILLQNAGGVLTIDAVTGVGSAGGLAADAALETQVGQLLVTNSGSGQIGIDEVDAITILGVNQQGPGNIRLTAGGTMTVAATVNSPGIQSQGGQIQLVTTGAASSLVLNSEVVSRGGAIAVTVGNDLVQAAAGDIATSGGVFSAAVTGDIIMANGAIIDSASGTLSLQAGGDVTVGQLITTNGTGAALLLRSGGAILDGGDAGLDILANAPGAVVTIEAANGIGSAAGSGANAALETSINTLVARNTTANQIQIAELDDLVIREVTQSASGSVTVNTVGNMVLAAGQPGVTATTGTVTLTATAAASSVTVNSRIQTTSGQIVVQAANDFTMGAAAQVLSQSGNVTITANADGSGGGQFLMANGAVINAGSGSITAAASSVTVNSLIQTTSGQIVVQAANDFTMGAAAQVLSQSGNVTITANADGSGGGQFLMANGAVINAGSGSITARADGNVTIGRLISTSAVALTSTSAGIVDGGDTGGADIIASSLVMQTETGIGSANALETAVSTVAANNTVSGAIKLTNSVGGLLTIGTIQGVAGLTNTGSTAAEITVVNDGGITVNGAVSNRTGGDIFLTAGGDLVINDTGVAEDVFVTGGGEILGSAGGDVVIGSDVVIRSASGIVTNTDPVLIDVLTPQISALGVGTITMTVQRPLEIGTLIVLDWGDGTTETFVVTQAGQQTFTFTHQYVGPPDPANPAADIDLKVTVQNPGVVTGRTASSVPGTDLVANNPEYVPDIRFAANGTVLTSSDVGVLNQTIFNGVFKTPGEGLASFIFDLTPPVVYLDFPQQSTQDASLLAVPQPPAQLTNAEFAGLQVDEVGADERAVILQVLGPDGTLLETVVLAEDVLDDIDGMVRKLPDGHYRFLLKEPGETQLRLLQDVQVREGKISDDAETSLERPRSLQARPMDPVDTRLMPLESLPGEQLPESPTDDVTPPADATAPENVLAPETAQGDALRSQRAWRRAVERHDDAELPAMSAAGQPANVIDQELSASGSSSAGDPSDSELAEATAAAVPALGIAFVRNTFRKSARAWRKFVRD